MQTKKRARRKTQKWQIGDYFLIPLENTEFALGQVIAKIPTAFTSATCVFFNIKAKTEAEAQQQIKNLSVQDVAATFFVTDDALHYGVWSVLGNATPIPMNNYYDVQKITKTTIGITVRGSGIIEDFSNAFYGLIPWDSYADYDYFDKLLVSPSKKPQNLIYKDPKNALRDPNEQPILYRCYVGDYFLVPLITGGFGIGQIIDLYRQNFAAETVALAACVFFNVRVNNEPEAKEKIKQLSAKNIILAKLVSQDKVDYLGWQIFTKNEEPIVSAKKYFNVTKLEQTLVRTHAGSQFSIEKYLNEFTDWQ